MQEERRRQAAEAAEKRQREAEGKGIKDPEAYKRKLEQREKMEREAERAGGGDAPLKVSHNNARGKTRLTAYKPADTCFISICMCIFHFSGMCHDGLNCIVGTRWS